MLHNAFGCGSRSNFAIDLGHSNGPCAPVAAADCRAKLDVLEALLLAVGDPNSKNGEGEGAVELAADFGHAASLLVLKAAGADFDSKALISCKREGHVHVLAILEAWDIERSLPKGVAGPKRGI